MSGLAPPAADGLVFSASERRDQVRRVLAAVAAAGGVIPEPVRALYGRYVVGELSLGQVCHQVEAYAAAAHTRTRDWLEAGIHPAPAKPVGRVSPPTP